MVLCATSLLGLSKQVKKARPCGKLKELEVVERCRPFRFGAMEVF